MHSLFKLIGWLLGLGLLAIAGLAAYLTFAFDPNDYRERITQVVETQTGRKLTIEGDLKLSLFPWIGIQLGATRLSNAAGFGPEPMAQLTQVDVRLALMPLLKREVEMETIILHGLHLSLGRNAEGRASWDDLTGAGSDPVNDSTAPQGQGQGQSEGQSEGQGSGGQGLAKLTIGGLDIRDAKVVWDDRQAGQQLTIEHLNLTTSALGLDTPFDLQLAFDLAMAQPQLAGHVALGGHIVLDLAGQKYRIDRFTLASQLKGKVIPGGALDAKLGTNLALDLQAQSLTLDALSLDALGLQLSGQVNGKQLLTEPGFSGNLKLADVSPRALLGKLGIALPTTRDASVLSKANLAFGFNAGLDSVALDNLKLQLDQTNLSGKLSVAHFSAPRIRYNLAIDAIDVDRYLPPKSEGTTTEATTAPAAEVEPELPLDLLRGLDIDGTLTLGALKVAGLSVATIALPIKAQKGKFQLDPSAQLYQGSFKAGVGADFSGKVAKFSVEPTLDGVQSGPLLQDMLGKAYVSGRAHLEAKLTTAGLTPSKIKQALNGTLALRFNDGAVNGISIGHYIRTASAKLKGGDEPTEGDTTTDFAELSASFLVRDGVLSGDDLSLKSPLARVEGNGSVDLVRELLNYRVNAHLVKSMEGQGGAEAAQLTGVPIPVSIKGSFSAPKIALEYDELFKAYTSQALDAKKAEAAAALEKKKAEASAALEKKKAEASAALEAEKAKLEEQKKAKEAELRAQAEAAKKKKEQELRDKASGELQKLFK